MKIGRQKRVSATRPGIKQKRHVFGGYDWVNDTIFLSKRGEALTPAGVHRRLADLARRAGVEVHPHTLRHTLAKNLVDAGVGLHEVAALLGHSSLNTTRVYVAPGERDLERAMRVLEG